MPKSEPPFIENLDARCASVMTMPWSGRIKKEEDIFESPPKTSASSHELQAQGYENKSLRRKRKRFQPTSQEHVDASAGLSFEGKPPKHSVHIFLSRYAGRDIVKGEDYWYHCEPHDQGVLAYLEAPIWRQEKFFGTVCDSEKAAEASAAQTFCEDTDVLAAAKQLPATVEVLKAKKKTEQRQAATSYYGYGCYQDRKSQGSFSSAKQGADEEYNAYRDRGYRMALWDGAA